MIPLTMISHAYSAATCCSRLASQCSKRRSDNESRSSTQPWLKPHRRNGWEQYNVRVTSNCHTTISWCMISTTQREQACEACWLVVCAQMSPAGDQNRDLSHQESYHLAASLVPTQSHLTTVLKQPHVVDTHTRNVWRCLELSLL